MSDYRSELPLFADQARVAGDIAPLIRAFATDRGTAEWHMEDLREWIASRVTTAPSSADRILRMMRQNGELNYRVVNRRDSRYQFVK